MRLPSKLTHPVRQIARRLPTRIKVPLQLVRAHGIRRAIRHVRERPRPRDIERELQRTPLPRTGSSPVRLLVAPANFAGQGYLWARAASSTLPGVEAHAFAVLNGVFDFPVDFSVSKDLLTSSLWQERQRQHVLASYTHVLIEAERTIFGTRFGREASTEIPILRAAGLAVALLAHGTDARIPSAHAAREEWSPFADTSWELIPALEATARRNVTLLTTFDGPVFVSTPDLIDDVPGAVWCPVVVDLARWRTREPLLQGVRPVVAHAPSNNKIKGSDVIDPIVQALADEGLIEYRRIEQVPPEQMPQVYGTADIVLDQFRLGSYGVAACEAMAAGRVVIGHVRDDVRERVRAATGQHLPIVQATPATVEAVLRSLVAERDATIAAAERGPAFVEAVHDGRFSAQVLSDFLRPGG